MGQEEVTDEDWARRYLDEMNDLVVVIDMATGAVVDVNAAGVERLGYDRSALIGLPIHDFVHDDDRHQLGAIKYEALAGNTGLRQQRWRRADGDYNTFNV